MNLVIIAVPISVIVTLFISFFTFDAAIACIDEKIPLCVNEAPDFNMCQGHASDNNAYEACIREQKEKTNSCQSITINQCKPFNNFNFRS